MQTVLRALLTVEAVFVAYVVWLGLEIDSTTAASRHVSAGILATIVAVFIHCLVLFYLNGTARAVKDAIATRPDLMREFLPRTRRLRRRAYPTATVALLLALCAAWSGGYVHGDLLAVFQKRIDAADRFLRALEPGVAGSPRAGAVPEVSLSDAERRRLAAIHREDFASEDRYRRALGSLLEFPVRGYPHWWVHLAILIPALAANIWAFRIEAALIRDNAAGVGEVNRALAASPAAGVVAESSPPAAGDAPPTPPADTAKN